MKIPSVKSVDCENVVLLENHNEVLPVWQNAGVKDKILVHIDAHIDFGWVPEKDLTQILEAKNKDELKTLLESQTIWNPTTKKKEKLVHIGNYICPAIQQGIVREFYWIVPDGSFCNHKTRKAIANIFKNLIKIKSHQDKKIEQSNNSIATQFYNKKVQTSTLAHLPEFDEPVLLDIDLDFLVTPSIVNSLAPDRKPWLWPQELVERLKAKRLKTEIVTIAYSVEGGFTPLKYKYLGDELKLRLQQPLLDRTQQEILAAKREALLYESQGKNQSAIAQYESVLKLTAEDPSVFYNLSRLHYNIGQCDQATLYYQKSIALDQSYRTRYNNNGPVYEALGKWLLAEQEYQRALQLDTENPDAFSGLGNVYLQQKAWYKAIDSYQRAIELRPGYAAAYRGLGYAYLKTGQIDPARLALEKSIALDSNDPLVYYWQGIVFEKKGKLSEAIGYYKKSIRLGLVDVKVQMRLGKLYMRKGFWTKAFRHYRRALKIFTQSIPLYLRKTI